ncbi:hypothetical protein B0H13DRAFT_2480519 [Mycena leptocephala]|nr:hypothetical protein B0H13DRAFT_2480519 [Mycena leptocephala]
MEGRRAGPTCDVVAAGSDGANGGARSGGRKGAHGADATSQAAGMAFYAGELVQRFPLAKRHQEKGAQSQARRWRAGAGREGAHERKTTQVADNDDERRRNRWSRVGMDVRKPPVNREEWVQARWQCEYARGGAQRADGGRKAAGSNAGVLADRERGGMGLEATHDAGDVMHETQGVRVGHTPYYSSFPSPRIPCGGNLGHWAHRIVGGDLRKARARGRRRPQAAARAGGVGDREH